MTQDPFIFAVMGDPVTHSLSPKIHQLFAKQFGLTICFERIKSSQANFKMLLAAFRERKGFGVNITMPLKLVATSHCEKLCPIAEKTGAVSHVWWECDENLNGANTDGIGLVRDITNNNCFSIKNKKILIIGAGGAARGVIFPLLAEKPKGIIIAARKKENAIKLIDQLGVFSSSCKAAKLDGLESCFDLIINATPTSLCGEIPAISKEVFHSNSYFYDMVYLPSGKATPFVLFAKNHNVQSSTGIGMLIEHNAEVFYHWLGCKPDTKPVLDLLKS